MCAFGKPHCKARELFSLASWGAVITRKEIRIEAGKRMLSGQLCIEHATQIGAIALMPPLRPEP